LDGVSDAPRPPSIDATARALAADSPLPHAVLVDCARRAGGDPAAARALADELAASLLQPVVNATGVLLHTNLGRAPVAASVPARAQSVEFDLATGRRGSRQQGIGALLAVLCGAEAAIVVNNNAAAVMLVLAALAEGRDVAVSRGESVEIGGGFRVPEVLERSGARLVDVGTTNKTRLRDYRKAVESRRNDVALLLKVHPSNFRVDGFVESTPVAELATLGVPVVADIGSGLVDSSCPWLGGPPPAWLADEPAARQALADGAAIVTFSGDKLLGGPQCGVVAGRRDLVEACATHPLARALRPGGLVIAALQDTVLAYLDRRAVRDVPFWAMVAAPLESLRARAARLVASTGRGEVVATDALPGAGSSPGATMPSAGVALDGDRLAALRAHVPPVVARVEGRRTIVDLRSVAPADDAVLEAAIAALPAH
jgi:L-seryl-tRNA(Ser) seleniumtransferase